VAYQAVLDLLRIDILTAGHDHLVNPALDGQPSRGVEAAKVTGRHQAVTEALSTAAFGALDHHGVANEDAA
jgi:hypothetical protein